MRYKSLILLILLLLMSLVFSACGGDDEPESTASIPSNIDPESPEGRGARVFQTYCATCHAVVGDRKIVGPPLTHIATVAETRIPDMDVETYLRESIIDPDSFVVEGFSEGSMQQNFATQLTSDQVNDVIAYLLILE